MIIDHPKERDIPRLKALWQQAFGDTDGFLDAFFATGFAPKKSMCIRQGSTVAAALYWLDLSFEGRVYAYVYAVATDEAYRRRGYGSTLMAHTYAYLKSADYAGILLVPGSEDLFRFYSALGYRTFCGAKELTCTAEAGAITLPALPFTPGKELEDFANSQYQRFENLWYVRTGDRIYCPQFTGSRETAAAIVAALGAKEGTFRVPGSTPFAMYCPLNHQDPPPFFSLAMD